MCVCLEVDPSKTVQPLRNPLVPPENTVFETLCHREGERERGEREREREERERRERGREREGERRVTSSSIGFVQCLNRRNPNTSSQYGYIHE